MSDATIDALLQRAAFSRERMSTIEAGMAACHEEIERCEAKLIDLEAEIEPYRDDLSAVLRAIDRLGGDPRLALSAMHPVQVSDLLKRASLDHLLDPTDDKFPSRLAAALGIGPSVKRSGS